MMPSPLRSSDPIIIVGGGTFGTSTAYHLAKRGYTSVTVLDRFPLPSKEAAGNDLSKIVRTEYPEPIYAKLAQEAIDVWKDNNGLFSGLYNQSGWLLGATASTLDFVEGSIQTQRRLGLPVMEPIEGSEIRKRWPMMTGECPDWKPYWNPTTAWVNAGAAVKRMAIHAIEAGVKYVSGDSGHAVQLLFDEAFRCIGVRCKDGTAWFGSRIILAAGAGAAGLLDLEGQIVAKGHTVGHIQLSREEAEKYKSMPIVSHLEGGLVFPPQKDGILKVAANTFVTNYSPSHPHISLPRYSSLNPRDGIPKHTEATIRNWLRYVLPDIADRPWSERKFCWDGDTADNHFLITSAPKHANLELALGGSAHGFKFLPVIGKYVVDMMEGTLDKETAKQWSWRPGATSTVNNGFPMPLTDLNDLPGWTRTAKL